MARYKPVDTSPRFLAVDLERQLVPGNFEHALRWLIKHKIDLSGFDQRYRNDLIPEVHRPFMPSMPGAVLFRHTCFKARCRLARSSTWARNALG